MTLLSSHQADLFNRSGEKFSKPDEFETLDHVRVFTLNVRGAAVRKRVFEPGWKWSKHTKPGAKSCDATHFNYHVSGVMHVKMDDGTEDDVEAGEVVWIPPGHDAWVVGTEPVEVVDIQGMVDAARMNTKSIR